MMFYVQLPLNKKQEVQKIRKFSYECKRHALGVVMYVMGIKK
jgi:hypothetical protein